MRPDYHYLNTVSLKTLSRGYLAEGIAKEHLHGAAIARAEELVDVAEARLGFELPVFRHGIRRGWVSPASPVWSNFGTERALPISCNGSFVDDDMDSIQWKMAEIGIMTKEGAGTSAYLGKLRGAGALISGGGKAEGPGHFARLYQEAYLGGEAALQREINARANEGALFNVARDVQEEITIVSQSNVRRGNCAIWLDIDHADIDEWLKMRSIVEGVHHPIQHLSFGVVIPDRWMTEMLAEPKGGEKRRLLARIVNKRRATGFPYLMFRDAANEARPDVLKELGLEIFASNLCTEIMLPSGPDESFVCNLSSVNLLYWDEWKDTNLVREMIYFLDAVMSEYIEKTDPANFPKRRLLADAHRFAKRWRALGLGTLGYHSLLQSKLIPFASDEARALNIRIHKHVGTEALLASAQLAQIFGSPEGMTGTGLRNLTQCAIAPTTSSSIILGQISKGIEPWEAVVFENDNAKGVFTHYNPLFVELLRSRGQDTTEVWDSILATGGSVDHLEFLTEREREVFKPWVDIPQEEIIRQAADRQVFIDQGQSLNLKIRSDATMKENVDLIVLAWKLRLKSLYYHEGENAAQKLARQNLTNCQACEA